MNKLENELYIQYPWLKIQTTVEEYVNPEYYNKIIKDYIFDDKTDLELFNEWLAPLLKKENLKILELGCGSGRVTEVLTTQAQNKWRELALLDLSKQMLEYTGNKFSNYENLKLINSDSIEFLHNNEEEYDLIYSLWSFSHSVHQVLTRDGFEAGKKYAQTAIRKMIIQNMSSNSEFFLLHFDSCSEEQSILLKQWAKVFPLFGDFSSQSLSKQLIDEELARLQDEGIISFEHNHYIGKEIEYASEDEALEVFMNFHMESFFNDSDKLPEVMEELQTYFKGFTDESGKVKIKPGCFIYKVKKI
ncbi:ubiE/COQ5 methyltransferase family protein (plasmid) [Bacillus pseudomycoides]|uniref:class I SAM-dependent methyltransferase n=1 Tax=Bacillus TaxID=1386 RepID=UPI000365F1D6|nr:MULTISPECIES: class I SAM-dependent methyltransferase [Bacillus]AIK35305.1 ubiE/COQ5 methyltransferase family protein [Bacillus pseudomycoides]AJI14560.1 ubiE/COQ5 methyltransferase family protein [Bacillus pseudomycoides]